MQVTADATTTVHHGITIHGITKVWYHHGIAGVSSQKWYHHGITAVSSRADKAQAQQQSWVYSRHIQPEPNDCVATAQI